MSGDELERCIHMRSSGYFSQKSPRVVKGCLVSWDTSIPSPIRNASDTSLKATRRKLKKKNVTKKKKMTRMPLSLMKSKVRMQKQILMRKKGKYVVSHGSL